MNAFAWRSKPSELATTDKSFRSPVVHGTPKPASHITYSSNVPHSINTETVADKDKAQKLRKGSPLFLPTVSDKAPKPRHPKPTELEKK
jgi:hypothetical protein